MPDITQRVKYVIAVDSTDLDQFKTKIDGVNTAVANLATSAGALGTAVNAGLLKSLSAMNTRLARTGKVGADAVTQMNALATPLSTLSTSVGGLATSFATMDANLKKTLTDLRNMNKEMGHGARVTKKHADGTEVAAKRTGMTWLRAFGVFQSAKYAVQQVFQGIKEGAQQLDLDKILGRQFANFGATIAKAQELTAGTVSKGGLTKSFALMSSFGIPMDKFAENMELVQKMALRTGQSSEYLAESFARGISRLSPLILDNLGLQVSLGQANKEYSLQTGILIENMTKEDKTAALLNLTLKKMKDATRGVSLETGSAAAAASRAEAAWDDLMMSIKAAAGTGIGALDEAFSSQSSDAKRLAGAFEEPLALIQKLKASGALGYLPTSLEAAQEQFNLIAKYSPDSVEAIDSMDKSFSALNMTITDVEQRLEDLRNGNKNAFELNLPPGVTAGDMGDPESLREFAEVHDRLTRNQEAAAKAVEDTVKAWGPLVTEEMKSLAVAEAKRHVERQFIAQLKEAKSDAKQFGVTFSEALWSQQFAAAELYQELEKIFNLADRTNAANAETLKTIEADRKAAEDRGVLAQDLYDLREGTRLVELEMNKVTARRVPLEKALQEAIEAGAAAKDDSARLEASRAEIAARMNLVEADAIRANTQLALQADKDVLASFKVMSKEKLKEMAAVTAFQIAILKAGAAGTGDFQTKFLAELENTKKMLDALIANPTKGGGGGGGKDKESGRPYSFWELMLGAKKNNTEAAAAEAGRIDEAQREIWAYTGELKTIARSAFKSLEMPGEMKLEGLPGLLFGQNMGVVGPEKFASLRAQGDLLAKTLKQLGDAGIPLSRVFSDRELDQMEQFKLKIAELNEHFETMNNLSSAFERMGGALSIIAGGMDELFGANYVGLIGDLASGFDTFSEALRGNKSAYEQLTGAMPIIRAFSQNLIKDRRAQAGVEALMQGAAAWAAFANPATYAQGVMHATAAVMYAGVAGGIGLRLPKGKSKDDKAAKPDSTSASTKMRDVHLHFDGIIPHTEAERGVLIRGMIREAERQGM